MTAKQRARTAAVALVVTAAVAIYALTDNEVLSTMCYLGVLVGASVGACLGAERAPRGQRLVPRLIAAGVVLTAVGDVVWTVLDLMGAGTDVSIADVPWLASYAVLCVALWIVLRRSRGGRIDVDFMIDAATIVVVSVLIFWSLSVDMIVADQSVPASVRAVWATYPVADAILLAMVVRVMMSPRARATIGASFGVAICLWLVADLAYLHAPGNSGLLLMADAAWMVAPVLAARAAWRLGDGRADPSAPTTSGGSAAQIVIAVGPLLVPPALELVADVRGAPDQPVQLFLGTAVLIALAFARTARLLASEQRAQQELAVARDAALDASRAKSMFLANMSHEIRTPLTTVLATAEILEDTPLDDVQLELLERMHRSGGLLKTLVEGILDFSRIEAGQLALDTKEFDLHAMVADVADVYVSRAAQQGVGFDWNLDAAVPRAVLGDPLRLFQVLTNLLDNAMKFTHDGLVSLDVRVTAPSDNAGEQLEFVVSDTGIGIPAQDLALVFESFSQVDGSMTRRYGGSGLGLAICKQLTELMRGSITVQSQLGAGTTFVIRIPLSRSLRERAAPDRAVRVPG